MPTALVTGASAGLGRAFAVQLAREGFDLVVVARDEERLAGLAAELTGAHGTAVEVLAADLTDMRQCQRVERRLADPERPVDLLVNNAGIGTDGLFWEVGLDEEERLLRLNVRAVMRLTHAALKAMVPRGTGGVLNVSSLAGNAPMPRGGTYAASKAWVTTFSESLHADLAGTDVRVCALLPGFVRTEFQQRAGIDASGVPGPAWLEPEQVVARGLRDLRAGRAVSVPGIHYRAVDALLRYTPNKVLMPVYRQARQRVL